MRLEIRNITNQVAKVTTVQKIQEYLYEPEDSDPMQLSFIRCNNCPRATKGRHRGNQNTPLEHALKHEKRSWRHFPVGTVTQVH